MKKLINFTLIAIACLAVACHKDAALTVLQPVKFNTTLTASTNTVILSATTDSTAELSLNWSAAVYPAKLAVKYTVQIDVPTDTATWAGAKVFAAGTSVLTATFKGADLNAWALALGIAGNDTGKLVFRVQAFEDRNVYSKAVTVTVSPYKTIVVVPTVLYLPGDYQGWSPGTAGTVAAPVTGVYLTSGVFEGYIYEPAGGTYHFKFTSAPDWNHINYGDAGTAGHLSTDGAAGDLVLPGPGLYELSANIASLTWSATPITWAIIGDATPNGWTNETEMTFDPATMSWSITLDMVTNGSFKFRANNDWNIDFGINPADNKIYYADNPILGGPGSKPGLNNLTVPASGNYTITLYLGDPQNYHYTAVKNETQ
jgi:starch-binding outer membrane protein SusE/F